MWEEQGLLARVSLKGVSNERIHDTSYDQKGVSLLLRISKKHMCNSKIWNLNLYHLIEDLKYDF